MTLREIFSGIGDYFNKVSSGVLDFDLTPLIIIFVCAWILYLNFIFIKEIYLNFKEWNNYKKAGMTFSFVIIFTMTVVLPLWLIYS